MTVQNTQNTQNAKLANISDLFNQLQINTNNHGETRVGSSKSPFESIIKGLSPHPKNTSPEVKIREVSPDYCNNKAENADNEKSIERPIDDKNTSKFESDSNSNGNKVVKQSPKENKQEEASDPKTNENKKSEKNTEDNNKKLNNNSVTESNSNSKNKAVDQSDNSGNVVSEVSDNKTEDSESEIVQTLAEILQNMLQILQQIQNSKDTSQLPDLTKQLKELFESPKFQKLTDLLKSLKNPISDKSGQKLLNALEDLFKKNDIKNLSITVDKNKAALLSILPDNNNILQKDNKDNLEKVLPELTKNENEILKSVINLMQKISTKSEDLSALNLKEPELQKLLINETIHKNVSQNEEAQKAKSPEINTDFSMPEKSTKNLLQEIVNKIENKSTNTPIDFKNETNASVATVVQNQNLSPKSEQTNILKNSDITPEIKQVSNSDTSNANFNTKPELQNTFDKTLIDNKNPTFDVKPNQQFTNYLTKAFGAEREIIEKIMAQANLKLSNNGVKEILINLTPPELGNVKIKLNELNGVVSGKIQVDNEVIKEIVQTNLSQLKASLNETMKIDKLEIEVRHDSENQNLNSFFRDKTENENNGQNGRETTHAENSYLNNDYTESFGIEIPIPKGVFQKQNGLLSVDVMV